MAEESAKSSGGAGRRVLLANPNACAQPYPVYPVALACLDGALRAAGWTTRS